MQLIIVTGMSGGGKSIAIRQLEDCGYYCIDNLPAAFLLPVAQDLRTHGIKSAAVAIDARSQSTASSFSPPRIRSSSSASPKPGAAIRSRRSPPAATSSSRFRRPSAANATCSPPFLQARP